MWRKIEANSYVEEQPQQQYFEQPTMDVNMEGVQKMEDGEREAPKRKLKPWEKPGPDGRPAKRKPNLAKRKALFRKALQPKSAIMCLNELHAGLKYITEPVATVGNFCVSVEVNGQTFRGYGSSKDLAKQAAAEAALVSFVKPPTPKTAAPAPPPAGAAPGGETPEQPQDEDTTPWRTLASFAMYKLFSDWRDGRIGMCHGAQQGFMPAAMGIPTMCNGYPVQGSGQQQAGAMQGLMGGDVNAFSNVSAHLNRNAPAAQPKPLVPQQQQAMDTSTVESAIAPKPIRAGKQNLESQRTQHPVMILHQLCPAIMYKNSESIDSETNKKVFTVSANVNGQEFSETATAIKKAKFLLAKVALRDVFNIDNIYTGA